MTCVSAARSPGRGPVIRATMRTETMALHDVVWEFTEFTPSRELWTPTRIRIHYTQANYRATIARIGKRGAMDCLSWHRRRGAQHRDLSISTSYHRWRGYMRDFSIDSAEDGDAQFRRWLTENPDGYFVNVIGATGGMLHRGRCPHMKSGPDDPTNLVTHTKWTSRDQRELVARAEHEGRRLQRCRDCDL